MRQFSNPPSPSSKWLLKSCFFALLSSVAVTQASAHGVHASNDAVPIPVIQSVLYKSGNDVPGKMTESLADLPSLGANFSQFELDNGMQVIVIPDHRAPVATHMVWYKVGSADEKPGETGIAHFLEHLMFKGTKEHPDGEFSRIIESVGGQENAFTSYDFTAYYQRVAKQHLPTMMAMEADRMANLVLREDQVNPERQVVQEERVSRTDSVPSSLLGEAVSASLYRNHPYGKPVIGWAHEIEKLDRETALNFYNTYYTPNNAILIVAGDVNAEEIKKLAKETYGKVKRRAEPGPRIRPIEPPQRTARTLTLRHERVTQPQMSRSYVVPSYTSATGKESYALDLLGYILGSGTNSRLYQTLVVKDKIATSAGAGYSSNGLDDTTFYIYGSPAAGKTLVDVDTAIGAQIQRLIDDGVSEEELKRAKRSILTQSYYSQDNQVTLANIVGRTLTTGGTLDDIRDWPQKLSELSIKDVQDVAAKYLKENRSVTGYLRAPKAAKPVTKHDKMPPNDTHPLPKSKPQSSAKKES
ncbi:M16 family metallopeptidase [Cohaesibacter gelatinilyticus]|uniref:Zinc protease n=1 Tax=Cohaesibacter gelatinilyticus TaxID=372072 RepID=A0A285NA20_9HYPH|nr:pitrilysin family protein [Cohaesibacter gelatinilyticus]SNZ06332.1 zinc protease [Cohaesibacter gelatinilyticus]